MIAAKLAIYYAAAFAVIGASMPFWPLWMQSRNLDPEEIGLVMAFSVVFKTVTNPLIAAIADRYGERKRLIILLTLLATSIFSLYFWSHDFWTIAIITIVFHAFWSPNMPLIESLTIQTAKLKALNYGRVRLWGSCTFIIGAWGMGRLLGDSPIDIVYWVALCLLALTVLSTLILPDTRVAKLESSNSPIRVVLANRSFIIFIIATTLIQASHAVYYSFSTIHWKSVGHSEAVIGWLWAEGVIAEIFLFIWGDKIIKHYGAARLITMAGFAGLIRWLLIGSTHMLPMLLILQLLHAFTFGAAHLGAMYFIAQRVDPSVSATAQTVYAVVVGFTMGLSAWASGILYGNFGSHAYYLMAAMAGSGGAIAYGLRRDRK